MLSKPSSKKPQPTQKEQKSTNTLLLIIIVVLVAIIGVVAGYIYFGSMNHPTPIINNTTNLTNSTNVTLNQTNVSVSSQMGNNITQGIYVYNNSVEQSAHAQGYIGPNEAQTAALNYVRVHDDSQGYPLVITDPLEFQRNSYGGEDIYVYTMTVNVGSQYHVIVDVGAEDGQVLHTDDTRYPD